MRWIPAEVNTNHLSKFQSSLFDGSLHMVKVEKDINECVFYMSVAEYCVAMFSASRIKSSRS
jgi:hypothetical protein